MKARRIPAILCVMALLSMLLIPASAVEPEGKVVDLGDGFYMVETITQYTMTRSGDTVAGEKTGKVYQGSTVIGTATLKAAFDISGTSAKAITASIEGSGTNGWGYKSGTTSLSGNKATGTAVFEMGSSTKSLVLTLTCSPNGTLS